MSAERQAHLCSALGVLHTEATLRDIRRALDAAGVSFAVLKGVHLGATVYERPENRPHNDVDILVRPETFSLACQSLEDLGFERATQTPGRDASSREFYDWAYLSLQRVPVEVHRALAGHGRHPVDVEALLARSETFRYGNTEVRGLASVDLLLHLCIHMTKSYFAHIQPKHVCDIATLLSRKPMDWEIFVKRATASRCRIGAYYALRAAVEQQGAHVPPEVLGDLRPARWRRWWIERWLDPGRWPICSLPQMAVGAIQVRLALSLLDRVRDWPGVMTRFLRVRAEDWLRALVEG